MAEPIPEKLTRWSLERVRFLLSQLEGFIEDSPTAGDEKKKLEERRERTRQFVAAGDLDKIERLVDVDPSAPGLATHVLNALAGYFEAGILLQRGPAHDTANWWGTDLFWRGNLFHLELQDQVLANGLVPEMTPLQVHRAPAGKMLATLKLDFLSPGVQGEAFLLRPTPTLAYILITNLAAPWSQDHLMHTQRLLNKCFIF